MAKQKTASNASQVGQAPSPPQPTYEREEDFLSRYANNIRLESTVYDLKLVFGQSDLGSGKEIVKQHSGITVPWSLVKLAIYILQVNLGAHELYNGKVGVPPQQTPPPFPQPSAETIAADPKAGALNAMANRIRDEFLASLQEP